MNLMELRDKLIVLSKQVQFGRKEQLAFLEDLYSLVVDGVPPNKALAILLRCSEGVRAEVIESLSDIISQGKPLAQGMRRWFSFNVVEMIRIGESSGVLSDSIKSSINLMTARGSLITGFIKAISYPAVVCVIGCIMLVYLNNSVLTQFLMIKPLEKWPDAGKQMVSVAQFISSWWWLVVVSFMASIIIISLIMKNYVGELRDQLDKIFPFSLYKKLVAAQFLETLGLLVSNGMVFRAALITLSENVSPYLHMHLARMEVLMSQGKGNIADVLNSGLIESNDLIRIKVLSEVKGFEQGLMRIGVRGSEQAGAVLKTFAKILAGVLMLVGGSLIMIAINGMYQTGTSMGQQ